jgi:hypothetical protein
MSRPVPWLLLVVIGAVACSDHELPPPAGTPPAEHAVTAQSAREHLAQMLAVALADPATRGAVKQRLDASTAVEGKLEFRSLVQADQSALLASLIRSSSTTAAELMADLDAARGLELYLPVAAQRTAWTGDEHYLVATIADDADVPLGFDSRGAAHTLDRDRPPAQPVLALVPQETDFTRPAPARVVTCEDCTDGSGAGSGSISGSASGTAPGLYVVQSHINEKFESWLKGAPEFEYHVYGLGDNGQSVELACTSEVTGGVYTWNQDDLDWSGSAMLFSDVDFKAYQAKHPGAPIRIVAWEDDDEPCVDHVDVSGVSALISAVDKTYTAVTSGKVDPWYVRGIHGATSIFNLVSALRNVILSNDDFIGNAVEGTITGDAPNGSNWVLKTNGTVTTGWFTTMRKQ